MRIFEIKIACLNIDKIPLGRQGENKVTDIVFDFSCWLEEFGAGRIELIHKRNNDDVPYPITLDTLGHKATWHVKSSDLAMAGLGECEARYIVDEQIVKSKTYQTVTAASLVGEGEAPDPWEDWLEQILAAAETASGAAEDASTAADRAEAAVVHGPYIRDTDKHWMVWSLEEDDYVDTGIVAEGSAGSSDHTQLSNRDENDQHPISAITGLQAVLDGKQPSGDYATLTQVAEDISEATSDMATETWVGEQGFLKSAPVLSINGKTGIVVLTAADLGIGSVFDLKGSVATVSALPSTGNKAGDVYYVINESVGYIWLNDGETDRWEMLGLSVDLSTYATKQELTAALTGYVAKVAGKGLSTNDFTDALKQRLESAITSLEGYRTAAAQDTIDNGIQDQIDTLMTTAPIIPVISKSEMSDHNKSYLLNGHIWRWETRRVESKNKAVLIPNARYSHSGAGFIAASNNASVLVVPVTSTGTSQQFLISDSKLILSRNTSYTAAYRCATNDFPARSSSLTVQITLAASDNFASVSNIPVGDYFVTFATMPATITDTPSISVNGEEYDIVVGTLSDSSWLQAAFGTEVEVSDFFDTGIEYGAGKSAYQIAVELGFEGTEHEWIESLRVPPNIVQTTGESTTAIMSQKAVTDAIADFLSDELGQYIDKVISPLPQKPADGSTGSDIDLSSEAATRADNPVTVADLYALIESSIARYPNYICKEDMGLDASGTLHIYRYNLNKGYYHAWYRQNYPRMYAWKNGNNIIYSVSVSPRIGDTMYSTQYIGTSTGTVSAASGENKSRTVGGAVYTRSAENDVEPTLVYIPVYAFDDPATVKSNRRLYQLEDGQMTYTNIYAFPMPNPTDATMTATNGYTYIRYPFGDLDENAKKKIPITIIANEHGGNEQRDLGVICARLINDLCTEKYADNPVLEYLRNNANITVIPCVNPWGWNEYPNSRGYLNYNGVNINRVYDTIGYEVYKTEHSAEGAKLGAYVGCENEVQYVMNTMYDSGTKVAISVHGLSVSSISNKAQYQGQNPNGAYNTDKLMSLNKDYYDRYSLRVIPYEDVADAPPTTTAKSPSYITAIGAYGGLIEFYSSDALVGVDEPNRMFTAWTMEQQYTLLLKFLAMWISDYKESLTAQK